MIDFERHTITLVHMNVRTERRGEEERPMIDLKFSVDLPNVELDRLSPGLRPSLYRTEDDPDLLQDSEHMPVLRHPSLLPLRLDGEVKPVNLSLHLGARARDDLHLKSAKLGKITVTALEGGTFRYGFRLQFEPSNNEASKLTQILKHDVSATLDVSAAAAVGDSEDEDEAAGGEASEE